MTKKFPDRVSLWHPWQDKPGTRHKVNLWSDLSYGSVEESILGVANGRFYSVCTDVLNSLEVDTSMVRDPRTSAFLSRSGSCSGLRIRNKRQSGFLIPSSNWCSPYPSQALVERMNYVFSKFSFEAITPASLSEKVLRSTLPAKCHIRRPNNMLRSTLLADNRGGRIDKKKISKFFPTVYENDLNKAYLHCSRLVPSPFDTPTVFGSRDDWSIYETAWMEVSMTCHRGRETQPIQLRNSLGEMIEPEDGQSFKTWLWSGEVRDCIDAGYSLDYTHYGWGWDNLSNFLCPWADTLWDIYDKEESEEVRDIIKIMMVGLPGRFLRAPETITLCHKDDILSSESDKYLPILNKADSKSPMSDWCMKVEENIDDAQLTPIGSFIIAECRRRLYHDCINEERKGNTIVRIYVDSFSTVKEASTIRNGKRRGEYKTKIYKGVRIIHNRFMGYDEHGKLVLKAPSYSGEYSRNKLISEMEELCEKPP